jgi:hypothetical protein
MNSIEKAIDDAHPTHQQHHQEKEKEKEKDKVIDEKEEEIIIKTSRDNEIIPLSRYSSSSLIIKSDHYSLKPLTSDNGTIITVSGAADEEAEVDVDVDDEEEEEYKIINNNNITRMSNDSNTNDSINLSITAVNNKIKNLHHQLQQHQLQQQQLLLMADITAVTNVVPNNQQQQQQLTTTTTNHSEQRQNSFNSLNSNHSNMAGGSIQMSLCSNGAASIQMITTERECIKIRGSGNITIFGLCNKFDEKFPSQLTAKLAPEEFHDTIAHINSVLSRELAYSFKWLIFGSLFCCCTVGCSLLPVIFMNKKARLCINKLLEIENQRIYLKLGLKWRLTKTKCNSNSLFEYVLVIDFLPTLMLYLPD